MSFVLATYIVLKLLLVTTKNPFMHISVGSNQNIVTVYLYGFQRIYTYATFIHNEDQISIYKVYHKMGNDSIGLSN